MRKVLVIDSGNEVLSAVEAGLGPSAEVRCVASAENCIALFRAGGYGVVVDGAAEAGRELETLERIRGVDPCACVIVAGGRRGMGPVVGAIKKGAFDYISKPIGPREIAASIEKAFQYIGFHGRLDDLGPGAAFDRDAIVGDSRAMEEVFKAIGIASQSKVTILIQGESGTGKELIARAIHRNSREKDRPFIPINCSALVETLLESELFGHEKGSFTGAVSRKEGKFEAANRGTVFLDEIGEVASPLQVKLLRVLQERCFERVGGSDTIKTDVRVIAASNRDLRELTGRGLFREDLYYRLKVITIDVPPLRERAEDIPPLVVHLLKKANRELGRSVSKVPEGIMSLLVKYPWPGNVRELENVITRSVLLARGDVMLDVFLPPPSDRGAAPEPALWIPATLDEAEEAHISKALEYTGWNRAKAERILGMTAPRLARKIRKYNLAQRPG